MPERFAIYYAPAADDPLDRRAAEWLGRDPADAAASGWPEVGVDRAVLTPLTVSARRYGFHATLKAPMALAPGATRGDLEAGLAAFAGRTQAVAIGPLKLARIEGFLALIPRVQSAGLTDFASKLVRDLDGLRAPLSEVGRARRVAGGHLSERQVALLDEFGYPYVLEQFQFHMTLTDRLDEAQTALIEPAAAAWFGALPERPRWLDRLALFHEPEPGAPFLRLNDYPLKVKADA